MTKSFYHKYKKYKKKYIDLKKQRENIDVVYDEDDEIIQSTDEKHPYYVNPNIENVQMRQGSKNRQTSLNDDNEESFDDSDGIELKETITIDRGFNRTEISKSDDDIIDVGIYGLARAIEQKINSFDPKDAIKLNDEPNRNKILVISSINHFDEFTDKYGSQNKYGDLYIKWDMVKDNYKGFHLNEGLKNDRYESAFYKGKMMNSWWKFEYKIKGFVIFV